MKGVSTLNHYNTPSIKQQNLASEIKAQTVIPDLDENANNTNEHSSDMEHADVTCNTAVRDKIFSITDEITIEKYCPPVSQLHSVNSSMLAVNNRQESNSFNSMCGASVTVSINIFFRKEEIRILTGIDDIFKQKMFKLIVNVLIMLRK